MNEISQFRAAIQDTGLGTPPEIIPDGEVHRFHCEGDRANTKNGWYCFYLDGTPAGVMGSWKTGISLTWRSEANQNTSIKHRKKLNKAISEVKYQRHQERQKQQEAAAAKAQKLWHQLPDAMFHSYLVLE